MDRDKSGSLSKREAKRACKLIAEKFGIKEVSDCKFIAKKFGNKEVRDCKLIAEKFRNNEVKL